MDTLLNNQKCLICIFILKNCMEKVNRLTIVDYLWVTKIFTIERFYCAIYPQAKSGNIMQSAVHKPAELSLPYLLLFQIHIRGMMYHEYCPLSITKYYVCFVTYQFSVIEEVFPSPFENFSS